VKKVQVALEMDDEEEKGVPRVHCSVREAKGILKEDVRWRK
jgi:hypothetical protein